MTLPGCDIMMISADVILEFRLGGRLLAMNVTVQYNLYSSSCALVVWAFKLTAWLPSEGWLGELNVLWWDISRRLQV